MELILEIKVPTKYKIKLLTIIIILHVRAIFGQ